MAAAQHAEIFPPSSAQRRMLCAGSAVLERGRQRKATEYTSSGTATHQLSEWCLTEGTDAVAYLGRVIEADGFDNEVTAERAKRAQLYVDTVRDLHKVVGGELHVEQALPIAWLTREEGAEGTGDAVIVGATELVVVDLKDGNKQVEAIGNAQLAIYAAAALELHALVNDFETVRMVIVQPRHDSVQEWVLTADELRAWIAENVAPAVENVWTALKPEVDLADFLNPGDEQCGFCAARATCSALIAQAGELILNTPAATADDFEDLTASKAAAPKHAEAEIIGRLLPHLDLIETWVKAVRSRGEELLHSGIDVPGYKLVEGKRGARRWVDADEAENALKAMRLKRDEMYSLTLISPTAAEKLLAKDSPKRWKALQKHITQSGGNPTVAPASDPRPALTIKPVSDEFEDLALAESADDLV
ncbi:DUF2800 domain-containing protein [Dongia sp.]|uniref:DUF2800 domain-containing protein n=1 Tax=Dongia sp. TaxID=1977262 RepID=UPI0035B29F3E